MTSHATTALTLADVAAFFLRHAIDRELKASLMLAANATRTEMKQFLRNIYRSATTLGIDPVRTLRTIRGLPGFCSEYRAFRRQSRGGDGSFTFGALYPCIDDRYAAGGDASGHYFHQDLLIAARIFSRKPERHIDVGSRVDGFVAHVASFRSISVIDIRPMTSRSKNIEYVEADMMATLPAHLMNCTDSLSCLHVLEHFGLGRYGDPIRWDGHLQGFSNLHCMLREGGRLYLSVPIGEQRVEFNAHRVFALPYLLKIFENRMTLVDLSFVDDRGDLHEGVPLDRADIARNYGCHYGCGIFELVKA